MSLLLSALRPGAPTFRWPARQAGLVRLGVLLGLLGLLSLASGLDAPGVRAANGALARAFPTLWSSLSVLGLALSVLPLALAACPGRSPWAMRAAAALLWCLPLGGALTHLLKGLIDAPRPLALLGPDALWIVGMPLMQGSMPSGHALTVGAMLAWCLCVPRLRRAAAAVAVLALLVMLARVVVGAHWPSDVLIGAALGLWVGCAAWVLSARGRLAPWLATRRGQLLLAALQGLCGLALWGLSSGYPLAQLAQWLIGAVGVCAATRRLAGLLQGPLSPARRAAAP